MYHPLHVPLGLAVWLLWFGAAYGGLSLGCALAPPAGEGPWNWLNGSLALSALVTAAFLLWLAGRSWRAAGRAGEGEPGKRFVVRVAAAGHLVGALGTLFVAYPLARLPPCL